MNKDANERIISLDTSSNDYLNTKMLDLLYNKTNQTSNPSIARKNQNKI